MEHSLHGRRIVMGITGGVAAYKAVELCRELMRRGAWVSPVLTASAERFIGAATLSAVASEPARTSIWESPEPSPHTDLGQAADLVVVAPATANFLAAARAGAAHDLLTTTLLATRAPLVVAPAMHTEMWEHAATRDNVRVLAERGVHIVDPGAGELAGGDVGIGRLADTADIVATIERVLDSDAGQRDLVGTTVLVSAGGTREPVDPVRFLGNRSSGKQGHAIAAAALARGARVRLVTTAPVSADIAARGDVTTVSTAQELHDAMLARSSDADVIVMAAAVADYRPIAPAERKLKRRDGVPRIELEATPDILGALLGRRGPGQTIVGFAAETNDVDSNAQSKLRATGVDVLVANDVNAPGAGFEHDTNAVTIYRPDAPALDIALCSKHAVADRLLDVVVEQRAHAHTPTQTQQPARLREVR